MNTETLESLSKNSAARILVIEDNDDAAYLVQFFLEDLGYSVAVARDGKSGLDMVRSQRPDIVLSDIGLRDELDGYAIAEAIRLDEALCSIYLIATSGYASHEDKVRARVAGFDEHLSKPLDLPQLGQAIAQRIASDGQRNVGRRI